MPGCAWPRRRTWSAGRSTVPLFPDFNTFEPFAESIPTPWSKAGGILPMPIDGRYLMYFGEGSIYYAWSEDLIHWTPCANDEPIHAADAGGHLR